MTSACDKALADAKVALAVSRSTLRAVGFEPALTASLLDWLIGSWNGTPTGRLITF
jgi:hypothetical protein